MVTGSFPFIGLSQEILTALPAGSTFPYSFDAQPFSSVDVAAYNGTAQLKLIDTFTITNDNSTSAQFALGNASVAFVERGRAANTFSLAGKLYDMSLMQQFLNEDQIELTSVLTGPMGAMSFTLKRADLTACTPEVGGPESVTLTIEGQATGGLRARSCICCHRRFAELGNHDRLNCVKSSLVAVVEEQGGFAVLHHLIHIGRRIDEHARLAAIQGVEHLGKPNHPRFVVVALNDKQFDRLVLDKRHADKHGGPYESWCAPASGNGCQRPGRGLTPVSPRRVSRNVPGHRAVIASFIGPAQHSKVKIRYGVQVKKFLICFARRLFGWGCRGNLRTHTLNHRAHNLKLALCINVRLDPLQLDIAGRIGQSPGTFNSVPIRYDMANTRPWPRPFLDSLALRIVTLRTFMPYFAAISCCVIP
ncbi:hypothetical protein GH714_044130 [Hevea brasiliensis]|uniref:Uncharacterized protein n=1 Tax=Hevea brasiliensis TaxID=3981 RepID=A0A6A6K2J3_HEVBR|nr:hypothetical protein GH714_044130 [Hevea brasiliensis]